MKKMLNFAVGPVMSEKDILEIGSEQVPYFRTTEFSNLMFENEKLFLKFIHADDSYKSVFITGSGTASMDAVISNIIKNDDFCAVVNGGSFGHRFIEILETYDCRYAQIKLDSGKNLTSKDLDLISSERLTVFIVNLHETSTGVLYDLNLISNFCKKHNLLLIVDAISCFLCDPINVVENGIDVLITGSQKALGCQPGISLIALSKEAQSRIQMNKSKTYYLNLKRALSDMERGQTPFTPAVGILRQIHQRFLNIDNNGGVDVEIQRHINRANYFRNKIVDLPFEIYSNSLSNAVTPIHPLTKSAYDIFSILKDEYGIWICPNGGELKDKVFRVGHMGDLGYNDYDRLIDAFFDMKKRGLL